MSIQRCELYGILSALCFIRCFILFHDLPVNNPIIMACVNRLALKYALPPTFTLSATKLNHDDWDITHKIHELIRELRVQVTFTLVKSPQKTVYAL